MAARSSEEEEEEAEAGISPPPFAFFLMALSITSILEASRACP